LLSKRRRIPPSPSWKTLAKPTKVLAMISGKMSSLSPRVRRKTLTLSENPSRLPRPVPKKRRKSTWKSMPALNVPTVVVDGGAVAIAVEIVETGAVVEIVEVLRVDVQMVLHPSTSMTRPPSLPWLKYNPLTLVDGFLGSSEKNLRILQQLN
jgi:hypothetical protein